MVFNGSDSTRQANDLIGVPDVGGTTAGAIVWWTLKGDVDADRLSQAWADAGLNTAQVPSQPAPQVALRRAVHELSEARRLARPLEGRKGYSLVAERANGDTLDYTQELTATVDDNGGLTIAPSWHDLAIELRAAYSRHRSTLTIPDISKMLIDYCDGLLAISLRERGGMYFVPPSAVPAYRDAARVLRAVSGHVCYEVPAMRSTEAVHAILDAVKREAAQGQAELEAILDAGDVGERGLRSKVQATEALEAKVAAYEDLLGTSLPAIHARLQDLRARLAEAAIVAAAEKDKATNAA
jgi:hypothetical protein